MEDKICDVLVVGGGVAGLSAALSAARCGAVTVLVESRSAVGGILRDGLYFPICGLFDSNGELLNPGVSSEMVADVGGFPQKKGRVYVLPADPKCVLEFFLSRMSAETGLSLLRNTEITGVEQSGGRIVRVFGEGFACKPEVVVDCSGNGVIIKSSDAEILKPDDIMIGGYSVKLDGCLEASLLDLKVKYLLKKSGLDDWLKFTQFDAPCYLKFAVPEDINPQELREGVDRVVNLLRCGIAAFAGCRVELCSPVVLSREGARLKGEYLLTAEDVLRGALFKDGVVKGCWPIEFWSKNCGQSIEYLRDLVYYNIPLGCMKSARVSNLVVAGRCISATSRALASTRVMGTCIALGEVAGQEAARLLK